MIKSAIGVLSVLLVIILLKVALSPAASVPSAEAKEEVPSQSALAMPSATLSPGVDANLANAYAIALASAAAAADRCEGMTPDSTTLVALKSAAKMTDVDDAWVIQKFEALKPQIQGALLKNGATQWCSATWELFGPNGLGAIRR